MKLVVGLGNPGEKYEHNRHNVGFMVLDKLNNEWQSNHKFEAEIGVNGEVMWVKPQTFMNDSGRAVVAIKNFYKIGLEDIFIVHDDLDIMIGNYKIQHGKGPQVHNGLLSIEQALGTDQFWNVRIGVENRVVRGNKGVPGVVYSLQDFSIPERKLIDEVVGRIVEDLLTRLG